MRIATAGAGMFLVLVFSQGFRQWQPASLAGEAPHSGGMRTVRMVLHPMPAPRPALRYQLLPPFSERRPGNAAVWWNRVTAEQFAFFHECRSEGGRLERIQKWFEVPLGDPREKELRKSADPLGPAAIFRSMDRAARFASCDCQLPLGEEPYFQILLPDLQQASIFGRLLAAKARAEIADGRFGDAVRTFQTGYALARHLGESPTLVSSLIGINVAGIMHQYYAVGFIGHCQRMRHRHNCPPLSGQSFQTNEQLPLGIAVQSGCRFI